MYENHSFYVYCSINPLRMNPRLVVNFGNGKGEYSVVDRLVRIRPFISALQFSLVEANVPITFRLISCQHHRQFDTKEPAQQRGKQIVAQAITVVHLLI